MAAQHPLAPAPLYTLPLLPLDAVLVEPGPVSAFELAGHRFIGHSLNPFRRMVLGTPRADSSRNLSLILTSTSNPSSSSLVAHLPVFLVPVL